MPTTILNGAEIAYDDIAPPGPAERTILLLHGFASNRNEGWKRTGWYQGLGRRGFRVIAMDQRGHGESARFHDPADYGRETLAADALALLDHLGVRAPEVFGYSMGTRTAMQMALDAPDRVNNLMLGGVGGKLFDPPQANAHGESIVTAMNAEDPASIRTEFLRSFRQFADEQGEDRQALAAFSQAQSPALDRAALGRLDMPVLVVAGAGDDLAGDPEALARVFPHGRGVTLPGCDHFSAIPHAALKATVLDFLDGMLDDDFPPFE
ncbi:alpha/beta fold hydrolase [Phenylobacterium sp.]|uniref:alpha/beta fold hydrolase n=1 Tax=Phenylobacterium sp. TaxID=1871053 RepID=UPI0025F059AC|nr:alpha/beta fold hydrolase [Phenylobacterium sp.]MBX3481871.1 alpha/beta fold hydrolase [Phenylobacterium sp.]MCW5759126.1 alpha/beta fold hydrolase [Phenylobacterium sp.]